MKINPNYANAARDRGITNADKREYDIAVAEADTAVKGHAELRDRGERSGQRL
jgi:hypothetical protein